MTTPSPPGLIVVTRRGGIPIPLRSRTQLLAELSETARENAAKVRDAIVRAGAGADLTLDTPLTEALLWVLHDWAERVTVAKLPAGIDELRSALARDLRTLKPTADVWPAPEPRWDPALYEPTLERIFAPHRVLITVSEEDVRHLLESLDAGDRIERDAASWIRAGDEETPLQPDIRTTRGLLRGLNRLDDTGGLTSPLRHLRYLLESDA